MEWTELHREELLKDRARAKDFRPPAPTEPRGQHADMLRVTEAQALKERRLRLTLSNGQVVERDVSGLMWGPVFERIAANDEAFAELVVDGGTAAWLSDGADIAPETLIWNGPEPPPGTDRVPPDFALVVSPNRPRR